MRKLFGVRSVLIAALGVGLLAVLFGHRLLPRSADREVLASALDSVYTTLPVKAIKTLTPRDNETGIRCDRLVLDSQSSIVRANLAITRAVKRVGGEVVYGVDSFDSHRRWQIVTLGISDGDSLIREIRLEKRIR